MCPENKIATDSPPTSESEAILQAVHDIRSPLTVLKILMAKLERDSQPVQRELLAAVFQRIEEISQTLLQQARPKVHTLKLSSAIQTVIHEKTIEYGPRVALHFRVDSAIADTMVAAGELMRALSNLINNSVEAGAKNICIEAVANGEKIELSISDDGPGIGEDLLSLLRSGQWVSGSCHGHGLGLRQVKGAALNGKLHFESNAGRGTRVSLSIPSRGVPALCVVE